MHHLPSHSMKLEMGHGNGASAYWLTHAHYCTQVRASTSTKYHYLAGANYNLQATITRPSFFTINTAAVASGRFHTHNRENRFGAVGNWIYF